MGKVILQLKDGKTASFRCKNQDKADIIASKRPNVASYKFYKENERIPVATKKVAVNHEMTLEELEFRISRL